MQVLTDIIDKAEEFYGDHVALLVGDGALTYAELIGRSRRLAGTLQNRGVVPGDRIALLARNGFRYIEVNFACALLGAILVPMNVRLARQELDDIVGRIDCRLAFCDPQFDLAGIPIIRWHDEEALGGRLRLRTGLRHWRWVS